MNISAISYKRSLNKSLENNRRCPYYLFVLAIDHELNHPTRRKALLFDTENK